MRFANNSQRFGRKEASTLCLLVVESTNGISFALNARQVEAVTEQERVVWLDQRLTPGGQGARGQLSIPSEHDESAFPINPSMMGARPHILGLETGVAPQVSPH